jgi:hypothetical protein
MNIYTMTVVERERICMYVKITAVKTNYATKNTATSGFQSSQLMLWAYTWNCVPHNKRKSGPGSSVGIATDYGLDGPGIENKN